MTTIAGVLLDLDGTVYRGDEPVPGAAEFLDRLRRQEIPYLFVTNRANRTPEEICRRLAAIGIPAEVPQVLTASMATAGWIGAGSVYYIGEEGMAEAVSRQGLVIDDENPDYVIMSLDTKLTYQKLEKAAWLIRRGARFVSSNPDLVFATEYGVAPGNGSLCAALTAATGVEPVVIGKPEKIIMEIALEKLGTIPQGTVMVGDNLATDIAAGHAAKTRTALILTGVSSREDAARASVSPTWIAADYEELAVFLGLR